MRWFALQMGKKEMERLINGYRELSAESNIPVRTCRTLVKNGVLPYIKTGHRTVFFSPEAIAKALKKREVKEVCR
jgi:hypothetical protein